MALQVSRGFIIRRTVPLTIRWVFAYRSGLKTVEKGHDQLGDCLSSLYVKHTLPLRHVDVPPRNIFRTRKVLRFQSGPFQGQKSRFH